jgi:hypothetical protein
MWGVAYPSLTVQKEQLGSTDRQLLHGILGDPDESGLKTFSKVETFKAGGQ